MYDRSGPITTAVDRARILARPVTSIAAPSVPRVMRAMPAASFRKRTVSLALAAIAFVFQGLPWAQVELASGQSEELDVVFEAGLAGGEVEPALRSFAYTSESAGELVLWAASADADPTLLVARIDATGELLELEDADSGGGTTACLRFEVEAGERVEGLVLLTPRTQGTEGIEDAGAARCTLHAAQAPRCDGTLGELPSGLGGSGEPGSSGSRGEPGPPGADVPEILGAFEAWLSEAAGAGGVLCVEAAERLDAFAGPVPRGELGLWAGLRLLDHDRWLLPATHPELLNRMQDLAVGLKNEQRAEEALVLEDELLAARRLLAAEDPRGVFEARLNRASTLYVLGRLDEAEQAYAALEEEARERLSPTDVLWGPLRQSQASVQLQRGYVESAQRSYAALIADLRKRAATRDEWLDLANALQNLGQAQVRAGRPGRAIASIEEARDRFAGLLDERDPRLELADVHLATALSRLGDAEGARVLLERVLARQQERLAPDHRDLLQTKELFANSLLAFGRWEDALRLLRDVVSARSRTLSKSHPELLGARLQLAWCALEGGLHEEARNHFEDVVSVVRATSRPMDHLTYQAFAGIAWSHLEEGRAEPALRFLDEAEAAAERNVPPGNLLRVGLEVDRAWALSWLDRHEEAAHALEGGLRQLREDVVRTSAGWSLRERRGRLGLLERFVGEAFSLLAERPWGRRGDSLESEAFALLETVRALGASVSRRTVAEDATSPKLLARRTALEDAEAALVRAARTGEDVFVAVRARDEAERALTQALQEEGLGDRGLSADASTPETIAASLPADTTAVSVWRYRRTRLTPEGRPLPPEPYYMGFLLTADGRLQRVDLGPAEPIERAIERWRGAVAAQTSSAVDPARGVEILRPGGADAGSSEVRRAGIALATLVVDPLFAKTGSATNCRIVLDGALHSVPFEALPLTSEAAPDEALGDVPRVGDRWRILRTPFLARRSDVAAPARATDVPRLCVMGGIDYAAAAGGAAGSAEGTAHTSSMDGSTSATEHVGVVAPRGSAEVPLFPPLRGTSTEIEGITQAFQERYPKGVVERREGSAATRTAFEDLSRGARFVHVATHAYFAPTSVPAGEQAGSIGAGRSTAGFSVLGDHRANVRGFAPMLFCGLAFAGANDAGGGTLPNVLSAHELARLPLEGIELAVLSACDTGLGVQRAGLGVASLQSALHEAGARTVLTSLWKVPDEATGVFMQSFYDALWKQGRSPSDALAEAQRSMRRARDAEGHPLFVVRDWAAWVLSRASDGA